MTNNSSKQYRKVSNRFQKHEDFVQILKELVENLSEGDCRRQMYRLQTILSMAEARLRQLRGDQKNREERESKQDEILDICRSLGITPLFDQSSSPVFKPSRVCLSPDGAILAVSEVESGVIKIFSASFMQELFSLFDAEDEVLEMRFSSSGTKLAAMTQKHFYIWDIGRIECTHVLNLKNVKSGDFVWSKDGCNVAMIFYDSISIYHYDLERECYAYLLQVLKKY